jgi:hypothetical protein
LEAKGFAEVEKDGERLVLSRRASDQLKPSPVRTVSLVSRKLVLLQGTRVEQEYILWSRQGVVLVVEP